MNGVKNFVSLFHALPFYKVNLNRFKNLTILIYKKFYKQKIPISTAFFEGLIIILGTFNIFFSITSLVVVVVVVV